ncbi:hypothetical protein A1O3_09861 [Capronia epimyces CBS 606.96]|uniref:HTH La-type RNA-binding domain-containing protein n=1 Tax=Capronia epimyces CBS 606.96 TaxID=1182542 RepID=W9XBN0_9EURO|nr:uncharacterized protein A1O3_09861 [Capronia epimyces CBS 606.96]EXJ77633.1 hypothetical protein A1O3_09861 [Capronia epimyces CBS 606.96]
MSTTSGAGVAAPVFSYAQAAKGLTPSTSAQQTPRNESPAASDKGGKDQSVTESSSSTSAIKSTTLRTESDDQPSLNSSGPKPSTPEVTEKENIPPTQQSLATSHDDKSSIAQTNSATLNPGEDSQRDEARPSLQNGRSHSEQSLESSSRDKGAQSTVDKKSKDVDDDWENVSVPSMSAEKPLKAAPPPVVNIWQQRKEAQEAKLRELTEQQRAAVPAIPQIPKSTGGSEDSNRKSIGKDTNSGDKEGKSFDTTRVNNRKDAPSGRFSRLEKADAGIPSPVGDAQSWPTPEITTVEERRKSSVHEKVEKPDAKEQPQKSHGKQWVPMRFVPTAKFETQLPPSAARRGGRGGARGRDNNGRGGHTGSPGEKPDLPGSMGPPPLPRPSGEQDRGRRSEGARGARGASVPTNGTRPASRDESTPSFRKPSVPASRDPAGADIPGNAATSIPPNGEDQVPRTDESSRSSSRHTGRAGGQIVNGEGHLPSEQVSGGWGHSSEPSVRHSLNFDRFKGPGASAPRGNGDFARDRGAGRGRDWSRDKPDSAREKVESWRDREHSGDHSNRRDARPDRGRGGFRGRGTHSYSPAFGSSHAYTSPLPQNGFEPAKSNSHGESRARQASQPYQPSQQAGSASGNPRSQSIPVGMMFPGYYNPAQGVAQGLPPLQTDMQVYGYPSPVQMQPGIMSAMAYNDPLNSYALLSMVMTQVEYYFSIDNLCKDLFLRKNMDGQGYVPLSVIANFKRIKTLTEDNMTIDTLRYVCQQVKSVEFLPGTDGNDRLRRRDNWRDFVLPVEERFESARNDGPLAVPEQYAQQPPPEQGAPFDPSFGFGQVRSPPLNVAPVNNTFHTGSPVSFVPGAAVDGHVSGGPFVPAFEGVPNEEKHNPSAPAYPHELNVTSPSNPALASFTPLTNGHNRQGSRADIEDDLFPDEHIPNINIRMQPRFFAGQEMTASFTHIAEAPPHDSPGGPKEDANGLIEPEQSRLPGLRGGAGSPQQLAQSTSLSFGFPNATTTGDGNSIIYFAKDGQETQLPPPLLGQYDQTYQSLHDVAFQQRQLGVEGALEPLYSFWSDFLMDKFNVGMYQEFKSTAVNDVQQGNGGGMAHLVRFYGKLLGGPVPVSERLASDMVALLREDKSKDRAIFHALRTAWRNGATNLKTIKRLRDVLTAEEKADLDKSG